MRYVYGGLTACVAAMTVLLCGCGGATYVTPDPGGDTAVAGSLGPGDWVDAGRYYDIYVVEPQSSGVASVEMFSRSVDSFLYVFQRNAGGAYTEIARNDDCGVGLDACIDFSVRRGDVYRIIATSARVDERGPYTIRFSRNLGVPALVVPAALESQSHDASSPTEPPEAGLEVRGASDPELALPPAPAKAPRGAGFSGAKASANVGERAQ